MVASPQIIVLGLNPSGKVPGAKFSVQFGKGRVSAGAIPRYLLLIGNMVATDISVSSTVVSNAGTATPEQLYEITPDVDESAKFGSRSELARMIRLARQVPGIRIKAIAVSEVSSGSPVAAKATITIATNASSAGTWRYWIGGKKTEATVASGATPTTQAAAIVAAINGDPDLPCYASNSAGVVTVTFTHVGTRGNNCTLYQDISDKPGGSTSTLATNSAYTVNPGPNGETGVRLGDGAGTDDISDALDALDGQTFFTIAVAHVDTTNLGLLKTYNDAKAAVGSQRFEHIVSGHNGLLADANTLSDAINKERFQLAWQQGSENLPGELAAAMGAIRTQYEQLHPNRRFDGVILAGIAPQRALIDRPTEVETGVQQSALDNGITPITSSADGSAICVRAITTKHLKTIGSATVDFYGTLDCGQARGPDVFAEELQLAWDTEYAANNEYVDDDPAPGEPNRPAGVATPRGWTGYSQNIANQKIAENWFSSVEITTQYDSVNKQLLCQIVVQPTPLNHRIGGNLFQTF